MQIDPCKLISIDGACLKFKNKKTKILYEIPLNSPKAENILKEFGLNRKAFVALDALDSKALFKIMSKKDLNFLVHTSFMNEVVVSLDGYYGKKVIGWLNDLTISYYDYCIEVTDSCLFIHNKDNILSTFFQVFPFSDKVSIFELNSVKVTEETDYSLLVNRSSVSEIPSVKEEVKKFLADSQNSKYYQSQDLSSDNFKEGITIWEMFKFQKIFEKVSTKEDFELLLKDVSEALDIKSIYDCRKDFKSIIVYNFSIKGLLGTFIKKIESLEDYKFLYELLSYFIDKKYVANRTSYNKTITL